MSLKSKQTTGGEVLKHRHDADSDWAMAMRDAIMEAEEPKPKGFFTRMDLEILWGVKASQVRTLVAKGVQSGKLIRKIVRLRVGSGMIRATPVYGMAPAKGGKQVPVK